MVLVVKCLICSKHLTYSKDDPRELTTHMREEHPLIKLKSERKSSEERRDSREKVANDWRQSLELNSENIKRLIDKEIQTEIDWNFFLKMSDPKQASSSKREEPKSSQDVIEILSPPKSLSAPAKISVKQRDSSERTPLKSSTPSTSKAQRKEKLRNNEIEMNDAKAFYNSHGKSKTSNDKKKSQRKHCYQTSIEKWKPVGDEKIQCPRCEAIKRPIVRTHAERVTQSSFASTLLMTCWPICFAPCLFPEPTQENLHCPVCNYHLGVYDHQLQSVLSNPDLSKTLNK